MKTHHVQLLKPLSFEQDGLQLVHEPAILENEFQQLVRDTYEQFTPARNASSSICRGIRWGTLANGEIAWSTKNAYQLSVKLNPEEGGRVREMDLISDAFLDSPVVGALIARTFAVYHPDGNSDWQPYVVQVSALRYKPELWATCYPSPDEPHQDQFNNGIFVLNKTRGLVGGHSRIYNLSRTPLFETELDVGDGLLVEDAKYLHQVLPMMVDTRTANADLVCRDILIIRIDAAHR